MKYISFLLISSCEFLVEILKITTIVLLSCKQQVVLLDLQVDRLLSTVAVQMYCTVQNLYCSWLDLMIIINMYAVVPGS